MRRAVRWHFHSSRGCWGWVMPGWKVSRWTRWHSLPPGISWNGTAWCPVHSLELPIRAGRSTKHMRWHARGSVLHLRHAVLHGVESWSRSAHHPREPWLANGMECHSRHRLPIHHTWHLRVELGKYGLCGNSGWLPRNQDVWMSLLFCRGRRLIGIGFRHASFLCRPFREGFLWNAVDTINLVVYTFSSLLGIGHPE